MTGQEWAALATERLRAGQDLSELPVAVERAKAVVVQWFQGSDQIDVEGDVGGAAQGIAWALNDARLLREEDE